MGWLSPARYETEFTSETARLARAVSGLDPACPIPMCPEWTVRDLVTHVGRGHRWAAGIVEQRLTSPPRYSTDEAPGDPAAWAGWLMAGATALADAVREAGADRPVWTWQPDRTAGFWVRRMLHDELVHRFDAELAMGAVGDVAVDLAADGVSDMLETAATLSRYSSRARGFPALAGSGETLGFATTDHAAVWTAERAPDGVTWRHGDGPTAVTVRAPARELLLLVNRRIDPGDDSIEVTGDHALLHHWLEHTRF